MSRATAAALVGAEVEEFLFANADHYAYAVRRVLAGETKEAAVIPMQMTKVLVPEGMHRCACGSRRITTVSLQLRSADESSTVFMKCDTCGKVWRV